MFARLLDVAAFEMGESSIYERLSDVMEREHTALDTEPLDLVQHATRRIRIAHARRLDVASPIMVERRMERE